MKRLLGYAMLLSLVACHVAARRAPALPPLRDGEGEVYLYLEPIAADAAQLEFTIASMALSRADGGEVPLELAMPQVASAAAPRQRLLAWGRVPAGAYRALVLTTQRATVRSETGRADLLIQPEPAHIPLPLVVSSGRATLLALSLEPARSLDPGNAFTPSFTAATPSTAITELAGYCTNSALANFTVLDDRQRRAIGVTPVGREPEGIAVDPGRNQAYVALAGDDAVAVVDLATGLELTRARLNAGDRPRELALTPDGRTLVVVNSGSYSVSFVDPVAAAEVARVSTGEDPSALLLDRQGRRAYVLNRRSNTMTVVDPVNRVAVATVSTEAEPVRAQLNRAGDKLYVIHAGSPFMTVFSLPALAVASRTFIGLGASAIKIDARTDLIYVGRSDDSAVAVFDPFSLMAMDRIELPEAVSYLTIDDLQNTLVALMPEARSVAFIDLAARRLLGLVDVGQEPYQVAVARERN